MKDLSEKELDDFFQKSLGGKQIPFNPKAWEKMEAKLEAARKKRLLWKRLVLGLLFLLLSFSAIIYQLSVNSEQLSENSEQSSVNSEQSSENSEQSSVNSEQSSENSEQSSENSEQSSENNEQLAVNKEQKTINDNQQPTTSNQQPATNNQQPTTENKEIKDNNNGVAETSVSDGRRKFNQLLPSDQLLLNKQTKDKSAAPSDVQSQNMSDGKTDSPKTRNSEQLINNQKLTIQKVNDHTTGVQETEGGNYQKILIAIDSIHIIEKQLLVSKFDFDSLSKIKISAQIVPTDFLTGKLISPSATNFPFGRLNIGLLFSPDWSSVKFQNINQTGYKLGFEIEYQPFKRLSISSGATFSRLLYNAGGGEYTVPYGYWNATRKAPEKIWGACDALEVPINLRYALFENDRKRFFISSGISSYWMLSESYKYEYYATKPYLVDGWRGKNKNTHYLSILNFSLGYAGKLGKRTFWQVEPFVKLPLGGVGWGKIDLSSTGMFLSIRYQVIR